MRARLLLWATLSAAALAALPAGADDGPPKAEWTVLVYLDADCGLEARKVEDLTEMLAAGSTKDVQIVALVDRHPASEPEGEYTNTGVGGLADWSDARLLRIDAGRAVLLEGLGEVNMGDPETLEGFVVDARRRFPAKRTALVLSGPGSSWRGICGDETSGGDALTLAELRGALEKIVKEGGPIDLLGLDAGLTANLEIAAGLSSFAQVLVASEEVEPGSGWAYTDFLDHLAHSPGMSAADLGKRIAAAYQASFDGSRDPRVRAHGAATTLSVVDLAQVDAVAEAAGDLGQAAATAIKDHGRGEWVALAQARERSEEYGNWGGAGAEGAATYDLGDLAAEMGSEVGGTEPAAVSKALAAAVLHSVHGAARPRASGLSIFLPRASTNLADYSALRMSWSWGGWAAFVREFARRAAADTTKPEVGTVARSPAEVGADGRAVVTATPGPVDDVADVRFALGTTVGDRTVVSGLLPARPDANGRLAATWDGRRLTLGSGDKRIPLLVTRTDDAEEGGPFLAEAPCEIRRIRSDGAAQTERISLLLRATEKDGALTGEVLCAIQVTPGGPREVPLSKGDRLRPLFWSIGPNGEVTPLVPDDPGLEVTFEPAAGLSLGTERVPAGPWLAGFLLVDFSGNAAASFAPVTVK